MSRLMCRMQEVSTGWQDSRFLQKNVSALSPEVKDLLDQILVIDPTKRITVEGIIEHPWYKQELPAKYQKALNEMERQQAELDRHVKEQKYDPVILIFSYKTRQRADLSSMQSITSWHITESSFVLVALYPNSEG